ncbi:hypothetical protein MRX96_005720 [Rhipicephalus microplus]
MAIMTAIVIGSTPLGEEACLSSSPFSVHDDSPGEVSPDAGSGSPGAISMAPSSKESRSCDKTTRVVGASTASGPARTKSPFWFTSPESVQPHQQLAPALREAVVLQPRPPGSGDGEDLAIDNRPTTAVRSPHGGWCPWWCWAHARASCCSQWPRWAPPTPTGRSSRAFRVSISFLPVDIAA